MLVARPLLLPQIQPSEVGILSVCRGGAPGTGAITEDVVISLPGRLAGTIPQRICLEPTAIGGEGQLVLRSSGYDE